MTAVDDLRTHGLDLLRALIPLPRNPVEDAAIHADDELIEALRTGRTRDLAADEPLVRLLATWRSDTRRALCEDAVRR